MFSQILLTNKSLCTLFIYRPSFLHEGTNIIYLMKNLRIKSLQIQILISGNGLNIDKCISIFIQSHDITREMCKCKFTSFVNNSSASVKKLERHFDFILTWRVIDHTSTSGHLRLNKYPALGVFNKETIYIIKDTLHRRMVALA